MNDVKHFNALLKSKLKRLERKVVEQVSSDIEKGARRNFNSARDKVSTDYPDVTVIRTKDSPTSATITCIGSQVLFIEFGVGHSNNQIPYIDRGGFSQSKPAIGFDRNTGKETMPRPNGIVPLGRYGKGRHSMQDFWIRPSATGQPRLPTEQTVHKRDKDGNIIGIRTDVVWTAGHPPVRALWRARTNALNKLYNPKIRKLPTRYLPSLLD